ncbi:MAG TPA: hypothetical protein VKR30_08940 [Candidatus Limnocylindrales bacterium]|nr:hypothetical protein [Candidatus Limnocylindrales bacterium]
MARRMMAVLAGLVLALTMAATAFADYGNTAVYQVEISANASGPNGGGAWLWIELSSDGTGTYAGSDCGHRTGRAASDKGDVTWVSGGGWLTISGVVFNGFGGLPVTITVHSDLGHYATTPFAVFGVPFPGSAQVTIAP